MKRLIPLLAIAVLLAACFPDRATGPDPRELNYASFLDVDFDEMTQTENGVWYKDVVVGQGDVVGEGETITVHYEGWLPDGTKFDSSRDRGEPSTFSLTTVILGWQEGVPGMRVGGTRKLVIPPDLAYGGQGSGLIPANSTLVFDIELLGIEE